MAYKKPPTEKQFEKGKSGNPNGRPKGTKNFQTLLNKYLEREIELDDPMMSGEDTLKVSTLDHIILRLLAKALNGDMRAVKEVLDRLVGKAKETVEVSGGLGISMDELLDAWNAKEQKTETQDN